MTFGDIIKSIIGLIIIVYVIWFVVLVGGVVFKYISESWDNISYLIVAIATIIMSGIVILHYINDSKKRIEDGVEVTYIVQCKNWSKKKDKVVHENVVCQLFGTTVQYELTHKGLFNKVVPVLVISHRLSATAEEFAKRLGVLVFVRSLGDYPMIKCNINNGNKIYHLPFDQQYYRTQIKLPGEFNAWTVKEAVDAGFRRARRHVYENQAK